MALAAIISVTNMIEELLESPRISVASSSREILQYAYDEAWLKEPIIFSWCSEVVTASNEETTIIEEARSLQDAIESSVSAQLLQQSEICNPTFSLNLDHLKPDVDSFAAMAETMKGRIEELWEQRMYKVIEQHIMEVCGLQNKEEEDVSASLATEMVGLDDEFQELRDILADPSFQYSSQLFWESFVCITGMGGVGKTTIAKRLYNDPMVKENFKCWAFVRVGRWCWRERVMRSLNAQLNHGDKKMIEEGASLEAILESLRITFRNKHCLIVLDDLWDYDILDYINELCKITVGRSLILVTSRLKPGYRFKSFKLRFMNEDESWELLRKKVFGEGEKCPPLLVEPGKKIARRCGGLPLLINALAPMLLQKAENDPESWKRVAEKPNSLLEEASIQISEVLLTSYNELDETHKLYFLYITVFPESYDVFCSTINNLLYAEGFHHFSLYGFGHRKTHVVEALLGNNLVLVDKGKSWTSDEIKSCTLHRAYWYLNKRVARDNRFLYIMNSYADGMDEVVQSHRRLAIQTNVLLAIKEVFDNITSISPVRSVLCTGSYNQYQVPICFEWKMLRVLDVFSIRFYEFPAEVVTLVLLRYLALSCNANLPSSISKLWNLQFLIVCQYSRIKRVGVESFVPVEIWDLQELILQELIHLEIMGRNMPEPPHPGVVLPYLTHLLDVGIKCCTKGVIDNIPKLLKLRVQIELAPDAAEYLACFCDVKSFKCIMMNPTLSRRPPPLSVPILHYVNKLSLGGFGYPWNEMSNIAKLPNLSVLKLLSYAFRGEKWEVNEQTSFMKLQYLYIEDTDLVQWIVTTDGKMNGLWKLKMKNCYKLHEIPTLPNLFDIELIDCNPLAEIGAKQRYKHDRVTATYSWKEKKFKSS